MTDSSPDLQDRLNRALAGQYVIERLLGQGGMGTVFLARDATLDRPVAIKVISPDVTGSKEIRERFLLEARTVARLRHPNIVSVYAAGESDGLLWFAMEFVPGESLRDRLQREQTLPHDVVAAITHDLAMALDDAHVAGVVHRDVKPENILLDAETGRAMLTDFGVARALSAADSRLTGAGFVLGSPRYMSPEQASGEPTIDGRSDLYSLGLVAYEMVAGRPVITAETPATILVKHLTEEPTPLRELAADVPDALNTVIARALRKAPEERFARGRAMAAVLEGRDADDPDLASGSRSFTANRLSGATRQAPRAPGRRVGPIVAGVAALGVVVFGASRLLGGGDAGGPSDRSWLVAPFELQTADASLDWLREGAVNMLGLTLSQWNDLSVVDYERTLDLLQAELGDDTRRVGLEDARTVARRAAAGTVVLGQVTTANDSLFVVARRYDTQSGNKIDEATAGAPLSGDPRAVFEQIARQLLDLAGGPAISLELAKQTTESVEAYRFYLDGISALNRWQLLRADSLLERAVQLDSTFALAYYKRSVGLGWRNIVDSTYVRSADLAVEYANRLAPRQREIITANRDLARGFTAARQGQADEARRAWAAAQARLATLVATDSMDAEAWYGLADADFHTATGTNVQSGDTIALMLTRSLRGFERAIALDSTFHLAYAHMVSLYQAGASTRSNALIDGDSIFPRANISDTARATRLIEAAQVRAKDFSSMWVEKDPSGSQAWQSLAETYGVLKQFDSAMVTLERASTRPAAYTPTMAYSRGIYSLLGGNPAKALSALREAIARYPADSLRERRTPTELFLPLAGMSVAGATGSMALLDSLSSLAMAVSPALPLATNIPTKLAADWFKAGTKLAMGVPPSGALLNDVRAGLSALNASPDPITTQVRAQSAGVLYTAYLVTGDTTFAERAMSWGTAGNGRYLELDAMLALNRGDTATARSIAQQFPTPEVLRRATLSLGGLRVLTQAEVRARLGDLRGAIAIYEAIDPGNFLLGLAEPGAALYSRSYMQRARILEQLGDRDAAITAYEQFMAIWKDADPELQPQVREARDAVARLRDAGATKSIGVGESR
jgi:eukaryotic-like serine/threonine-protein kinase